MSYWRRSSDSRSLVACHLAFAAVGVLATDTFIAAHSKKRPVFLYSLQGGPQKY